MLPRRRRRRGGRAVLVGFVRSRERQGLRYCYHGCVVWDVRMVRMVVANVRSV